jgi:hypothetical protein
MAGLEAGQGRDSTGGKIKDRLLTHSMMEPRWNELQKAFFFSTGMSIKRHRVDHSCNKGTVALHLTSQVHIFHTASLPQLCNVSSKSSPVGSSESAAQSGFAVQLCVRLSLTPSGYECEGCYLHRESLLRDRGPSARFDGSHRTVRVVEKQCQLRITRQCQLRVARERMNESQEYRRKPEHT